MSDVTVVVEPPLPDVNVVVEPPLPEVRVVISEVGLAGPPGASGSSYTHVQSTPAATWTVIHGMNKRPPLTVVLASAPSEPVYTDVQYPDLQTAVITLPSAETGWVYI